MFRLTSLNRSTLVSMGGLLVGIVGLIVQWIAVPAKFSGAEGTFGISFPPGIAFIAAFGLLTLLTARWWWHGVFGAFIAFWIVGVGSMADQLQPNLFSDNPGTVAGNVVMSAGLIVAFAAGLVSAVTGRRNRKAARSDPGLS